MLKIPKGLKKKKKGKKGKHKGDEDLFTPEELEAYRRAKALKEQQQQHEAECHEGEGSPPEPEPAPQEVASTSGASPAPTAQPPGDSEEWERFKALTGGVDSILNKTQRDLDRIKSTSFFQRKPTPSELEEKKAEGRPARPAATSKGKKKRWVGFEEGHDEEEHVKPPIEHEEQPTPEPEAHEEEEESEEEDDDADDIFDTSYIDVITSGEVKLAYIPDSPTEEEADGDDPFDTSYAEKVIGKEDPKKKKLVSLGCAVEVLTGKVEKPEKPQPLPELAVAKKRPRAVPRRVKPVDLLLGSFDEGGGQGEAQAEAEDKDPKSLLDDDSLLAIPEDLPPVGTPVVPPVLETSEASQLTEEPEKAVDLTTLVSEFDVISEVPVIPIPVSNVALVTAVLGTHPVAPVEEDDDLEDEFAALAAESLQKKKEEEDEFDLEADDPFDTTVASVVLGEPHKPDPVVTEPVVPVADVDVLLAGPPASWSAFDEEEDHPKVGLKPNRPPPPRPVAPGCAVLPQTANVDVDPFDTSTAQNILPGKTELKFIESEILGNPSIEVNEARILSGSDSDFDFNPREGEEQKDNGAAVIPDDPFDDSGLTALRPIHRDLLGGSTTDLSKLSHDPIAPAPKKSDEIPIGPQEDIDPFDTSVIDVVAAPGRAELKYLEKEILGDAKPAPAIRGISDEDFDPRADEDAAQGKIPRPDILVVNPTAAEAPVKSVAFALPSPTIRLDLLAAGNEEGTKFSKPLTPYYAHVPPPGEALLNGEADVDPFDTTHISNLAPGKAELKILESELVGDAQPALKHTVSDDDFNPRAVSPSSVPVQASDADLFVVEPDVGHKPLTPAIEQAPEVDPFDTAFASNIAPGKTELKLLENELISGDVPQTSLKRTYTDPDFNPRDAPAPDLLNQPEEVSGAKPLTPLAGGNDLIESGEEDIDPFDTSIAGNLGPGKTELRILESEFIGHQ